MKDFYTKITEFKRSKGVTNEQLGSVIGKKEPAFRIALKRQSLSDLEIEKLEHYFDNTEIKKDDRLEDKNKIIELLEQQVKSNNEIKELLQELKEMKRGVMINGVMISEVKEYLKEYFKTKTK
jgi:hypothetical protein